MKHVKKINEFVNESLIYSLIEKAESTPSSDPEHIANREPYLKVIEMGERVIPYLVERSYIWNIGLKKLTGVDPVGTNSEGIMEFWKKWAIDNGYTK
jgi:hypothetical protein